jgi:predicted Zn finger-like uncharacterized protein
MQIACPSCKKTILLEDSKVPAGPFKLKCPGCATSIPVTPAGAAAPPPAAPPPPRSAVDEAPEESVEEALAASGLEPGSPLWERLKHEVAHQVLWHLGVVKYKEDDEEEEEENKRQALVVEDEAIFQQAIAEALRSLRYRVEVVGDKQKALDVLSRKTFDLVTVDNRLPDDPEGGYQVLQAINALPPDQRRRMFVAFISADLATMDTQSAFVLGANLTVGKKDLRRLDKILQQAIREHDKIYHIFRSVHEELQSQET